jgi:hypothetical protein
LYCHNNPINFIDPLGLEEGDSIWRRTGRVAKTGAVVVLNVAAWVFTGPIGGCLVTGSTLYMTGVSIGKKI